MLTFPISSGTFKRSFLGGDGAADCGREARLVERRTQAADHPVRVGFPESQYLKCLVLELS